MRTHKPPVALLAALALLALAALVAGCGDNAKTSASGNATDAAFITDMTTHHRGAIEMAEVAQQRAVLPAMRKLADDIISAQEGQISVMTRIGDDMRAMGTHGGGHMDMSQAELGMDVDMPTLRRAEPFDRAFIDMMVAHHQGAIAMAREQLDKGSQPALRMMAQEIIEAQTRENAQMRVWRKAGASP